MHKLSRALFQAKSILFLGLVVILLVTWGVNGTLYQLRCTENGLTFLLADTDTGYGASDDLRNTVRKDTGLYNVAVFYFSYASSEEYVKGIEGYTINAYLLSQAHSKNAELIVVDESHLAELLSVSGLEPLKVEIPKEYVPICSVDGVVYAYPFAGVPVTDYQDTLTAGQEEAFGVLVKGSDHVENARAWLKTLR